MRPHTHFFKKKEEEEEEESGWLFLKIKLLKVPKLTRVTEKGKGFELLELRFEEE